MIRYCRPWFLTCVLAVSASSGQDAVPVANPSPDAQVYFIPFSHLDFYWGGTREECLARGNQIIAKAIQLANRSPKFRFLLEDNVFVANYVESHLGSQEVADLKRLVKEGRIEIAPKWVGIFQGLPGCALRDQDDQVQTRPQWAQVKPRVIRAFARVFGEQVAGAR